MKDVFVGIDWAKDHHDICVINAQGVVLKEFRIQNTVDGFALLDRHLQAYKKERALVCIETNTGLLFEHLIQVCYRVFVVNPGALKDYRKRYHLSMAKTDKIDARLLANFIRTDLNYLKEYRMNSKDVEKLKILTKDRERLHKEKVRLELQLVDTLKLFYPAALELFSDITNKISLAFLEAYPSPSKARVLTLKKLQRFLIKHKYTMPQRTEEIHSLLNKQYPEAGPIVAEIKEQFIKAVVPVIKGLQVQIEIYDKEISKYYDNHPDKKVFESLPGVGDNLGPQLLACIGDIKERYSSANALQTLSGTAPITKNSGNRHTVVLFRFACNKQFRNTMYLMAFSSLRFSSWAKNYYLNQRQKGKRHSVAIRALGNKWLKIIYKLWLEQTPYNENKHLAHITRESFKLQCAV